MAAPQAATCLQSCDMVTYAERPDMLAYNRSCGTVGTVIFKRFKYI
jgi:hypothetical protein